MSERRSSKKAKTTQHHDVEDEVRCSADTDARGLGAFHDWLSESGFWLHPRLRVAAVDGKGLGVVVAPGPPVPAGTVVMRCPESKGLRAESSHFLPQLRKLRRWMAKQGVAPLSAIDELVLSVGHELKLGTASAWAPYLAWLPLAPDRELAVPLLWGESDRGAVKGTCLASAVDAERAELSRHYESVIAPAVRMLSDPDSVAISSERDYARIGAVVRGYAFTDVYGTGSEFARLLPLVDVMNHSSDRPTVAVLLASDGDDQDDDDDAAAAVTSATVKRASTNADGPMMVARTTQAIWAGGEAMLSYGRLSSAGLLSRYGFVPDGPNPHNEVVLSAEAICDQVVAAAAKAHRVPCEDSDAAVQRARSAVKDAGLLDNNNDDENDDEEDQDGGGGGGDGGRGGGVVVFRSGRGLPASVLLMVRLVCLHLNPAGFCAEPEEVDDASLARLAAELEAGQREAGDDEDAGRAIADVQMRHALLQVRTLCRCRAHCARRAVHTLFSRFFLGTILCRAHLRQPLE
jgi:hypothetical protein